MGVADPDRLGVGGWSYGGILTDYMIATDTRFKAPPAARARPSPSLSTAPISTSFSTTMKLVRRGSESVGDLSEKSPIRSCTPTGSRRRRCFSAASATSTCRSRAANKCTRHCVASGIDTQLIIYPNENHGITRPSYVRDRYERYLGWYDKYVKKNPAPAKKCGRDRMR